VKGQLACSSSDGRLAASQEAIRTEEPVLIQVSDRYSQPGLERPLWNTPFGSGAGKEGLGMATAFYKRLGCSDWLNNSSEQWE